MALLWFGGVERYKHGPITTFGAFAPANTEQVVPAHIEKVPLPNTNTIRIRTNGQNCSFNIAELSSYLDPDTIRKWLEIRTLYGSSTFRSNRYFEIGFFSKDIPEEKKVQGTVICFGLRFRQDGMTEAMSRKYIGYAEYTDASILASPTFATGINQTLPVEVMGVHPLMTRNQEKYLEVRVKYMANNVCLVKIFVNKDLVHTAEKSYTDHWGIFFGSPRKCLSLNSTAAQSLFFNDFYMGLDEPGEEDPTDLIGPVTVKPLEIEEPTYEGEWTTSDPTGEKSMKDILSEPLVDKRRTMTGHYIISDTADRPAVFKFKPPVEEKLKIVAFQHDLIAQQPLAYSTSLKYNRTVNGVSLEKTGGAITVNVALEPNFSHVGLTAITKTHDGKEITPEYIGSLNVEVRSTKKFVPDDIDEEEPPPAVEETE